MMMDLADDAAIAVKAYAPGDPEIYLAPLDRIKSFLKTHHLGGQLSSFAGYLDDSTLTALAFTDHVLQLSFSPEHPGATKDAREFIVMLDTLLEECLTSELNQELKELFVTNLEFLRKALIQYRVGGEAAVQSALDKVTGSIIRNQGSIKENFEQAQEFVEKTAGFMGRVEEMIGKSKSLAALASPVIDVLLPFLDSSHLHHQRTGQRAYALRYQQSRGNDLSPTADF